MTKLIKIHHYTAPIYKEKAIVKQNSKGAFKLNRRIKYQSNNRFWIVVGKTELVTCSNGIRIKRLKRRQHDSLWDFGSFLAS